MPRGPRLVVPGLPHHVTHRGNDRRRLFGDDNDRLTYVNALRDHSREHGLEILGYCIMPNHVHLIARPPEAGTLAATLRVAHLVYAQHFNRRYDHSGHLWQGRFYSCVLSESHFWNALGYVERNPVRAGLAPYPWDYLWSSAPAHAGVRPLDWLVDLDAWRELRDPADWKAALLEAQSPEEADAVRAHTRSGRPLGDEGFLEQLEARLKRRLRARPIGRPRKRRN